MASSRTISLAWTRIGSTLRANWSETGGNEDWRARLASRMSKQRHEGSTCWMKRRLVAAPCPRTTRETKRVREGNGGKSGWVAWQTGVSEKAARTTLRDVRSATSQGRRGRVCRRELTRGLGVQLVVVAGVDTFLHETRSMRVHKRRVETKRDYK